MILDTSAIVATLADEPDATRFQNAMLGAASLSISSVTLLETRIVLESRHGPQAVRELKAQSPLDITVAGPTLAAHAIRTGLVDEYQLLVVPTMLGGGTRVLPSDTQEVGSPGRAPFCQWNGLSSLSHAGLIGG